MNATTPLLAIQEAMYAQMTEDEVLMDLLTGVFDEVPEGQAKPYVVIGEALETPRNTHDGFGRESVVTLHIWSVHRGFAEALGIEAQLVALFDHQPLDTDGQHTVSVRYEFSQTLRDPEPGLRHIVLRFRISTEQTNESS